MINLIQKNKGNTSLLRSISEWVENESITQIHPYMKIGDVVEFNGGLDGDIRFKSKIIGFTNEGGVYILWDCYWFPVNDLFRRNATIIKILK